MSHISSAAVTAPVRPLARTVPMALAGVVVASVAFAAVLPIVARATDVELVNEGSALVQTEGTLVLHRTTVSGPVSAGGNLANTGESLVTGGAVAVPRVGGGSREVQLYVGGTPVWADSGEQLLVNGAGGIAVQGLSRTDLDDTGTDIVLTPQGSTVADASIRGTFDQGADEVPAADLVVDTAGTFAEYVSRSDKLATCEQTVTVDDDGVVYLQPGITNVWNVTEGYIDAQLAALNLNPAPSADTKLIVNITDAAGQTLSLPWGMTEEISSHVLYNFVGEGRVAFAGVRGIRGTVYAPGFDVSSGNPGVIQGNVIARSFGVVARLGGGLRIENYPFVGPVECGEPVVAPTTPPATTAGASSTTGTTMGATPATTTVSTDVTATTAPGSATTDTSGGTAMTGTATTGSAITETAITGTAITGTASTGTASTGTTTPATGPGAGTGASETTGTSAAPTTTSTPGAQTTAGTPGAGTATIGTSTTTTPPTTESVPPTAGTAATNAVTTSTTPTTQPASAGDPATAPSATAGTTTPTTTSPTPVGGGALITPPADPATPAGGTATSTTSSSTATTGTTAATTATPVLPGAIVTTSTTSPADPLAAGDPVVPGAGTSAASASVTSGGAASLAAASAARPGGAPARIAFTGADVAGLVLTGLGLLAAGVGMTWTTRRQNAAGRHIA